MTSYSQSHSLQAESRSAFQGTRRIIAVYKRLDDNWCFQHGMAVGWPAERGSVDG
jgi:hypothetical protein